MHNLTMAETVNLALARALGEGEDVMMLEENECRCWDLPECLAPQVARAVAKLRRDNPETEDEPCLT